MQHIGVIRETERGELLDRFDHGRSIDLRIVLEAPASSSCLRFIDPYGNLVINGLQLPVLISELKAMLGQAGDGEFKKNIAELIRWLEADKRPGESRYIRFVGD